MTLPLLSKMILIKHFFTAVSLSQRFSHLLPKWSFWLRYVTKYVISNWICRATKLACVGYGKSMVTVYGSMGTVGNSFCGDTGDKPCGGSRCHCYPAKVPHWTHRLMVVFKCFFHWAAVKEARMTVLDSVSVSKIPYKWNFRRSMVYSTWV